MSWKWWVKTPAPERNLSAEQAARAQAAVNALPVLKEACGEVREALMDNIIRSGPEDYEAREYFYHAVKGLDAAMAMVETYARRQDMVEAMAAYSKKVQNG